MRQINSRWHGAGIAGIVAIAGGLSACTTTLKSTKVDSFEKVAKGQVYFLPRSEYQVQVSRELRACTAVYQDEVSTVRAWLKAQLENAGAADSAAQGHKVVEAILVDPIFKKKDLKASIDSLLADNGTDWRDRILTVKKVNSGTKQSPIFQTTRVLDDDVRLKLIEKLAATHLRSDLKFEVEITAQVAPNFVPDADRTYTLDYSAMSKGIKATDYAVEMYPGGRLKSVNVTVDDQTAQVIGSVIGGVAKIAAAAGGFPLGNANALEAGKFSSFEDWKAALGPCKPDVQRKLYQRGALEAQSEASAETIASLQKELEKKNAAQVEAIAVVDKAKAALKELDESDPARDKAKAAVIKAERDQKLAAAAVAEKKKNISDLSEGAEKTDKRLAAAKKALTAVHTTTFRPTSTAPTLLLHGGTEVIQAWLDPSYVDCAARADCTLPDKATLAKAVSAEVAIYAPSVTPKGAANAGVANNAGKPPASTGTPSDPEETGVFYRQPLSGSLMVCKGQPCLTGGGISAPNAAVVLSTPVEVPQFGALAVLPLTNSTFQNNAISVSFSESGGLTKVTYKSNAALAKAGEVFESSADTLMKFREAKRNQETSKLETSAAELAAKKKVVDAQLALEKSQADLEKFRNGKADTDGN